MEASTSKIVPRLDSGRQLISDEECINQARISLGRYVQYSEEELLKIVRKDEAKIQEKGISFKRGSPENIPKWKEKLLYVQFTRLKIKRNEETLTWLREGNIRREIEVLIFATKDQEVQTIYIKGIIDKSQTDSKCRMCKEKDETITHIVSACLNLA